MKWMTLLHGFWRRKSLTPSLPHPWINSFLQSGKISTGAILQKKMRRILSCGPFWRGMAPWISVAWKRQSRDQFHRFLQTIKGPWNFLQSWRITDSPRVVLKTMVNRIRFAKCNWLNLLRACLKITLSRGWARFIGEIEPHNFFEFELPPAPGKIQVT